LLDGDGIPLSLEYIAVEALWKGGDGVDASDPYGDVTCSVLRARVKLPSIVVNLFLALARICSALLLSDVVEYVDSLSGFSEAGRPNLDGSLDAVPST